MHNRPVVSPKLPDITESESDKQIFIKKNSNPENFLRQIARLHLGASRNLKRQFHAREKGSNGAAIILSRRQLEY